MTSDELREIDEFFSERPFNSSSPWWDKARDHVDGLLNEISFLEAQLDQCMGIDPP